MEGKEMRMRGKVVAIMACAVIVLIGVPALSFFLPTVITPPASPNDPVHAYVITYARTSSLLIPCAEGMPTRFVYGDWNYYALRNRGIGDIARALFLPTQGTLGWERTDPIHNLDDVRNMYADSRDIHIMTVERRRAFSLCAHIEQAIDEASAHGIVHQSPDGLSFVQDERAYSYIHNSNHVIKEWLERLDCDVQGPAYSPRWRVRRAPDDVRT